VEVAVGDAGGFVAVGSAGVFVAVGADVLVGVAVAGALVGVVPLPATGPKAKSSAYTVAFRLDTFISTRACTAPAGAA